MAGMGDQLRGPAASGDRSLPPLHVAAVWVTLGLTNAWFVGWSIYEIALVGFSTVDWAILADASRSAEPYAETLYRWSPLLLGPLRLLTAMPFPMWAALHVAAALALPTWRLRFLVLASWPFWQDMSNGNVLVFILAVGVYAMRGRRWAQWAFLALALVIPRPLMLPLAVCLLWQHSELRVPFAMAAIASVVSAGIVGPTWFPTLLVSGADIANDYNFGPSAIIGILWVPLGSALAAWLIWKGRIGLASLAASPYWLPYYLLIGFLEFDADRPAVAREAYAAARDALHVDRRIGRGPDRGRHETGRAAAAVHRLPDRFVRWHGRRAADRDLSAGLRRPARPIGLGPMPHGQSGPWRVARPATILPDTPLPRR